MFVLIHSPLVGPSSLIPTARALERREVACHVPVLCRAGAEAPAWSECPELVRRQMPPAERPILVGHSAAGLLAAGLAPQVGAAGIVFLDAAIAPGRGPTPPVEPQFLEFVRGLADGDGRLPRWSDWWKRDLLQNLGVDPALEAAFRAEQPTLSLTWFDGHFQMPDWSACPGGYLQTSSVFDAHADEAERRGWPVVRLAGTHLHPFLEPEATADALVTLRCRLAGGG